MTAFGGALVTGAWVRITRAKEWRYAWHFGIGAVILVLARPFEGLVLLVPALVTLAMATRSARVWLPIVLVGVLGASGLIRQLPHHRSSAALTLSAVLRAI